MHELSFLALTGGLLAACWSYIRSMAWRVASLAIVRAKLEGTASHAMAAYLEQRFKRSRFGERRFVAWSLFVRPVGRSCAVAAENLGTDTASYWQNWKPVFFAGLGEGYGGKVSGEAKTGDPHTSVIWCLRWHYDLEKLVITAVDAWNEHFHKTQLADGNGEHRYAIIRMCGSSRRNSNQSNAQSAAPVDAFSRANAVLNPDFRPLRWKQEELGEPRPEKALSFLSYNQEALAAFKEIERWYQSSDWYLERGIPWRRGLLLYGEPGTGKSSLARAIAQQIDVPIASFDLASFDNQEFIQRWSSLRDKSPCIALFEDIDAVFEKRENRLGERGGGLTFDCLLNCLGGVENGDGIVVVITTNHLEALDPALGVPQGDEGGTTRPGRIDRAVYLGPMDEACRLTTAHRILNNHPELAEKLAREVTHTTAAQFTELCVGKALQLYWQQKDEDDDRS